MTLLSVFAAGSGGAVGQGAHLGDEGVEAGVDGIDRVAPRGAAHHQHLQPLLLRHGHHDPAPTPALPVTLQ